MGMKAEMTQVEVTMLVVVTLTHLLEATTQGVAMLVEMQIHLLEETMLPATTQVVETTQTPLVEAMMLVAMLELKEEMLGQKVEMPVPMQEPKVATMPLANLLLIQQSTLTPKATQSPNTTST